MININQLNSILPSKKYKHLNKILIFKTALIKNHKIIQNLHPSTQICPVLKSNAYGHGLEETAPIFDQMKSPFLVVDSLYEAYKLYKLKVKTPILIMGYTNPINFKVKRLPFHIALFDLETAQILDKYQPNCQIHIFVDTGMCREGITINKLSYFLDGINKLKNLKVAGLCSHLADADNPNNKSFTNSQIESFKTALEIMKAKGVSPKWRHISASGGALTINDPAFNMIRAGLLHYGISPCENPSETALDMDLSPALEFTSTLALIKEVPENSFIGYSGTYKTNRDAILGLLPAGYYEGVDRRLSNKGFVKIRDNFFPIVGKVSMNMTTIDISNLKDPQIGETVVVYSSNLGDKNSIVNSARLAETIPYLSLIHI